LDLSIIIVNYNVKEFLQNLLHSIDKASSNISKEIIVIDNASDDGSVEVIKEKFPSVKLIENKINVGFGRANNQGLAIAKGKYILFINPDCIVSEDLDTPELLGYTPTYKASGSGPEADDGCYFEDVSGGDAYECEIINDADPVTVEIEKDWIIVGSGGDQIDQHFELTIIIDVCYGRRGTHGVDRLKGPS